MKRFIIFLYDEWEGRDEVTSKDLINVRDFRGHLIDTAEGKYFDPDSNTWKEIK